MSTNRLVYDVFFSFNIHLQIDYRSFMDKLWEAMPCDEFIMMASDQRFLGNPLLKTQHFVGLSTWQKVSDDEVIGTHQVRVPHQRYTDSSMREVAVKGHSHGTATMWYKRVELEWKFAGVCPHIRWCEYDYDKVFAEGKDHYGEKAENEENEEKGVKEANREKARKEEKIEKAGKEANGANEANGADHYAYIKSDPTDQVAMHASAEVQAATLEKFIDGWSKWTPDDFLASWSENCTQTALPFGSGSPTHSRAELEHLFPKLMSTLTNFQVNERIFRLGM